MPNINKKMRIQYFDDNFNLLDDKLLLQDITLSQGPKDIHKGPLKIEVCLFEQEDINLFFEYIEQLRGLLPLRSIKRQRKSKEAKEKDLITPNKSFLEKVGEIDTAEKFNLLLKEYNFVYTVPQLLNDLKIPVIYPTDTELPEDYRLMIRMIKRAKNPLSHKYDPSILIFTDRMNANKIFITELGKIVKILELPDWHKSQFKTHKSLSTIFPRYMTLEERNKFRIERSKLDEDLNLQPSPFYRRWVHFVDNENKGRGITFPRIDQIEKPF